MQPAVLAHQEAPRLSSGRNHQQAEPNPEMCSTIRMRYKFQVATRTEVVRHREPVCPRKLPAPVVLEEFTPIPHAEQAGHAISHQCPYEWWRCSAFSSPRSGPNPM